MSLEQIARVVDRLEDQDAHEQRRLMDRLVAIGEEVVEPLVANMAFASPLARTAVIRVLGEIGSTRAMGPLMRYVFDKRGDIDEQMGRGLAMQAIMQLAQPEHARKLFDFLVEMREDADPFVRGYAVEALGRFGDQRARPLLEQATRDEHEFVRERAQQALMRLGTQRHTSNALESDLTDLELLQKVRGEDGGEREYYVNELLGRHNAFELAAQLVSEHGRSTVLGLQLLLRLEDPRAREVAVQHFRATPDTTQRAIALRILAQQLQGDADDDEVQIIEYGLAATDDFVRLAAVAALGASGRTDLVGRAVRMLDVRDPVEVVTVAESLARGMGPSHARFVPQLRDALVKLRRRRRAEDSAELMLAEGHVLSALREALAGGHGMGVAQVQLDALESLQDARDLSPILVSALKLLRDTLPPEGLAAHQRWPASDAMALVYLLDHPDHRIQHRALDLLLRGAPEGLSAIAPRVERLLFDDRVDLTGLVIPLLRMVGTDHARALLTDLSRSSDESVRLAAEDALRTARNQQRVLDARFTRKPD